MRDLLAAAAAIRRLVHAAAGALAWLPPTLARITLGWLFLQTGWGKLDNLPDIVAYFGQLGIPYPQYQAPFAAATELVCGALLLVGLGTRLATVPLIIVMTVALATAQRESITGVADLFGLVEFLYIALLVWLGVAGPGPLSIDRLLAPLFERRASATRPAGDGVAGVADRSRRAGEHAA